MWTPSSLIEDAVAELKLGNDSIRTLSKTESSAVLSKITSHFLTDQNALFWWEFLKLPSQSWTPESDSYHYLNQIVPDSGEPIWLIPTDDDENPVFETSTSTATQIIGECAAFEYAICNLELNWLIIENHHDCLIAVGDTVIEKMNQLAGLAR